MNRFHRPLIFLSHCFVLMYFFANLAHADVIPDAGRALDTLPNFELKVPSYESPLKTEPEPEKPKSTAPAIQIVVKQFHFKGNTVFTQDQLRALLNSYLDRALSGSDLELAVATVSKFYRQNGYTVARAYLPPQAIKEGQVEIGIIEGQLSRAVIEPVNASLRLKPARAQAVIESALPKNDVLSDFKLERGLLLLNDYPGISAQGLLRPGDQVGTSELLTQVQEGNLFSGSIDFDNAGNKFLGIYRLGATINVNNPSGYGDLLSLTGYKSGIGFDYGAASYQIPIGATGLRAGINTSYLSYFVNKGSVATLKPDGTARVLGARVQYPWIRSRLGNLTSAIEVNKIEYLNRTITGITGEGTVSERILRTSGDWQDTYFGGGINLFDLALMSGDVDLDGSPDQASDASTLNTQGGFEKANLRFIRLQGLTPQWSLYGSLSTQWTTKNLSSTERFSLGGIQSIRAYPQGEASGDEGILVNIEARYLLSKKNWLGSLLPGQVQFVAFVDAGRIRLYHSPVPGTTLNQYDLYGTGLGVNWSLPSGFSLKASMAYKIGSNPGRDLTSGNDSDGRQDDVRYWVQLSNSF